MRELAAQIPDSLFPYAVTVVKDDSRAEPVVLPGGYVYVSTGMFRAARSESEFAGLMAHTMMDVTQRTGADTQPAEDVFRCVTRHRSSGAGRKQHSHDDDHAAHEASNPPPQWLESQSARRW